MYKRSWCEGWQNERTQLDGETMRDFVPFDERETLFKHRFCKDRIGSQKIQ